MEKSELIALAVQVAMEQNLPPALVCAVCEQESQWNPLAIRYEPGFMSKYIAPQYTKGGMTATEAYSRAFSWGLMQVMGEVARELGFEGAFLSELCDPRTGIEWGCKRLAKAILRTASDPEPMNAALLNYNGGSNALYADQVLTRMPAYESSQQASA